MTGTQRGFISFLQEFSLPLIAGVVVALGFANLAPETYQGIIHAHLGGSLFGHELTFELLINDVFMVFFFGIAAKEIAEATLPGGSLNPIRKAINPLVGTLGGIVGPVAVFFVILAFTRGFYPAEYDTATLQRGWGIPTATDIALAWLVARAVFGRGHAAINFLLLLAVADDAIGLVIIAVFYGDPHLPTRPEYLGLIAVGMAVAFTLRKIGVRAWLPYILFAGPLAWLGLGLAHLHPALALVFIVPFLPGPKRDTGLFAATDEADEALQAGRAAEHSPLHEFEHQLKLFVDLGLFFFAFANAGVQFTGIGPMTWTILGALVIGKSVGITLFSWIAIKVGFPLPTGMSTRDLFMAAFIGALGLTVALFVAGAAFTDAELLGQAKMGALFSGAVGFLAIGLGRVLGCGPKASAEPAGQAIQGQRQVD